MASAFACAERLTRVRLSADLLGEHGDWLAVAHHPLHSLTSAAVCKAADFDGAREAAVSSPGQSETRAGLWWIVNVVTLLIVAAGKVFLGGNESVSDAPNPVQALTVAPTSGPKGTTVEITGGPCPAMPEGKQPFGIYFGLNDPTTEAGKENPAGSAPLIPGKPWKGQLQIPHGASVGQYFVYAGCSVTEADGTEVLVFYKYENSTFEVVEP